MSPTFSHQNQCHQHDQILISIKISTVSKASGLHGHPRFKILHRSHLSMMLFSGQKVTWCMQSIKMNSRARKRTLWKLSTLISISKCSTSGWGLKKIILEFYYERNTKRNAQRAGIVLQAKKSEKCFKPPTQVPR